MKLALVHRQDCRRCSDCYHRWRVHSGKEDLGAMVDAIHSGLPSECILEVYNYHLGFDSLSELVEECKDAGVAYSVTGMMRDLIHVPCHILTQSIGVSASYCHLHIHELNYTKEMVESLRQHGVETCTLVRHTDEVYPALAVADIRAAGITQVYHVMNKGNTSGGWKVSDHLMDYCKDHADLVSVCKGMRVVADPCVMTYMGLTAGPCMREDGWYEIDTYGDLRRCPYSAEPCGNGIEGLSNSIEYEMCRHSGCSERRRT